MPWWLGSILANLCIAVVEYVNRTGGRSLLGTLPYTALFILGSQIGLYFAWRGAPSFFTAWVVFASGSTTLRVVTSRFILEEPMAWSQVSFGIALVYAGALLVKMGSTT